LPYTAITSAGYARYIFFEPGSKISLETGRYLSPADEGLIMNGFIEYLESNGVKDIKKLAGFVHNFLQDPAIFFDLTEAERDEMEQKLDGALAFFKI
jgi:hypothetical protein